MSLTTYGGLLASLDSWSTYTNLTDALKADFVAWAHQEIIRRLRASAMLVSGDITISAETISKPTGFIAFKRLYLDTTPRRRILTDSAEGLMDRSDGSSSGVYPTHVAVEGALLRFGPLFTWTGTGKALYYAEPDALTVDADTNDVMTKYPYLYLYGSLEALHAFKEDDEQADRWGQKFGALIEDINRRDALDVMAGPSVVSPRQTIV